MPVTSYSTTAASNNAAPPNGFPEGQTPGSLNNSMRQVMADLAYEFQVNDVKSLNSIAGVDTITADMDPELAAYVALMTVCFTPAGSNTGAATINIDGLGAKSIVKGAATALIAGDLLSTAPAMLVYNGTAFVLLNPQTAALTAAAILAALLTVDGAGSGLDADLLDGVSSAAFAAASHTHGNSDLTGYTAADVLAKLVTVDGAGSGLDADLLDGNSSAAFALAATTVSVSGTGLSGGGSLAANRTITIDQTAMKCRNITGAAGVAVTVASDPGGTPSGSAGDVFEYY